MGGYHKFAYEALNQTAPKWIALNCTEVDCSELHRSGLLWIAQKWIALNCTEVDCSELHRSGLLWTGPKWIALNCTEVDCSELHRSGLLWTALKWIDLNCTEVDCSELYRSGLLWTGPCGGKTKACIAKLSCQICAVLSCYTVVSPYEHFETLVPSSEVKKSKRDTKLTWLQVTGTTWCFETSKPALFWLSGKEALNLLDTLDWVILSLCAPQEQ
jgi:hypothetical protein